MTSIKEYRIDIPKDRKEAIKRCKVTEFLEEEAGKDIVSDFYSDLKGQNGSRFPAAFESAVRALSRRVHAYWLLKEIVAESYRLLDAKVIACLEKNFSPEKTIEILATCVFWILHDQDSRL